MSTCSSPLPPRPGAINTTTYTIRGLDEKRSYFFQIYGGDETQGDDFDTTFFNLGMNTTILRTCLAARKSSRSR